MCIASGFFGNFLCRLHARVIHKYSMVGVHAPCPLQGMMSARMLARECAELHTYHDIIIVHGVYLCSRLEEIKSYFFSAPFGFENDQCMIFVAGILG